MTGSVAVWDEATGTLLWRKNTFDPPPSYLTIVAFSPDGTTLVASDGTKIGVFDGATGEELVRFASGRGRFSEMHFTPDGAVLVAGDSGNLLRMFDTASWEELAPINATEGEGVRDFAFSSDRALAATVSARVPQGVGACRRVHAGRDRGRRAASSVHPKRHCDVLNGRSCRLIVRRRVSIVRSTLRHLQPGRLGVRARCGRQVSAGRREGRYLAGVDTSTVRIR